MLHILAITNTLVMPVCQNEQFNFTGTFDEASVNVRYVSYYLLIYKRLYFLEAKKRQTPR